MPSERYWQSFLSWLNTSMTTIGTHRCKERNIQMQLDELIKRLEEEDEWVQEVRNVG